MTKELVDPRKEPAGLVSILKSQAVRDGFNNVATKHLTSERMVSMAVHAVSKTPDLLKCDQKSVLGAMMTCTSLGLEPNTALGHMYLIPYANKRKVGGQWVSVYECQVQIGYRGFIELARRIPELISLQAECIHENDLFEHCVGTDTYLKFQKTLKDRGEPIGAFAHAKFKGADGVTADMSLVMPLEEILKIRDCSGTYTSLKKKVDAESNVPAWLQAKFDSTPWVQWFGEMAAKSAIKRLCKQLPLGRALAVAAEIDNASETGSIDLGKVSEVDDANAMIEHGDVPMIENQAGDEELKEPLPEKEPEQKDEELKVHKATAKAVAFAETAGKDGKELPAEWAANPKLVTAWEKGRDANNEEVTKAPEPDAKEQEPEVKKEETSEPETQKEEVAAVDTSTIDDDAFGV